MKAEALKKSILQYAMQGKLVPQDPNDEPAYELLKRIKAEKEQLIKEGEIKKEKPLPPITEDEIPFELPKGWEWVRLNSICKLETGKKVSNVSLPLLNAKYLRHKIEKQICDTGFLVNKGDYIILVDGENSGEVFQSFEQGIMGSTFKKLEISSHCDVKYILYILKFFQDLFRGSKKGAAIPHLDKNLFKNIVIGLPPMIEQQRIVKKLEQILPLVEEYGKNEEKLSELNKTLPNKIKQSILQYAIQGKLVSQNPTDEPASELLKRIKTEKENLIKDGKIKKEKPLPPITEDEIPFELPKGWEWVRFAECLDVRDGTHDSPKYQKAGYPFITSKNLNNGKLDFSNVQYISEDDFLKFSARSYVENEDILFAMIGSIGNPVIVKKDKEFSIKNVALFKKSNFISVKYLYYYLLYLQDILKNNATGAVQSFVSLSALRLSLLVLPPLSEQQRIVEKVEELLSIVDKLKV